LGGLNRKQTTQMPTRTKAKKADKVSV